MKPADADPVREGRPSSWTLEEIAKEHGLPLHLVRRASNAFKHRYVYPTGRRGQRLHSPAAVRAICKHVEAAQARLDLRSTDDAAAYWQGLAALGGSVSQLAKLAGELRSLASELEGHFKRLRRAKPSVTGYIHTLPDPCLQLVHPIAVLIRPLRKVYWQASLAEAGLTGSGRSPEEAALDLRDAIARAYLELRKSPLDLERWQVLDQLIRKTGGPSGRLK